MIAPPAMHGGAEPVERRRIMDVLGIAAVLCQPVRAAGSVCAAAPRCPTRMGGGVCAAETVAQPMVMVRSARVPGGGALPLRRVARVAGDDISGEAARAAGCRAAGLLLLPMVMMVMVPLRPAGNGVGNNVSVEGAAVGMPVPAVSVRALCSPAVSIPAVSGPAVLATDLRAGFRTAPMPLMLAVIGSRYDMAVVTAVPGARAACDARAEASDWSRRVEIGV